MNENIIVAITKLNEIVTDIDKDDTCFLDIKDTVEEVIALLKAKDINVTTKWISVKDRLPEENKAVNIVWVNHNPPSYYQHIKDKPFVATGVYYDGNWYWWSDVIEDVIAEYGGRVDIAGMIDPDIEITHWQSLPEPPKENEA